MSSWIDAWVTPRQSDNLPSITFLCLLPDVFDLLLNCNIPLRKVSYIQTRDQLWFLTAAAAKLFQSCPALGNPIDGSPPGSSVPGILQAKNTGVHCHFLPHGFWLSCVNLKHQFSSVAQLCPTLCDPMDCSTSGLPVHHQLPELTQTHVHWVSDAIQPSHSVSSPSPPAFNLSQHQGLFQWVSSLHQVAKVLEFQLQHQYFQWKFRTDFF